MRLLFTATGKAKPVFTFSPASADLAEGASQTVTVLRNGSPYSVSGVSSPNSKFTVTLGLGIGVFIVTFVGPADPVVDIPVGIAVDVVA